MRGVLSRQLQLRGGQPGEVPLQRVGDVTQCGARVIGTDVCSVFERTSFRLPCGVLACASQLRALLSQSVAGQGALHRVTVPVSGLCGRLSPRGAWHVLYVLWPRPVSPLAVHAVP